MDYVYELLEMGPGPKAVYEESLREETARESSSEMRGTETSPIEPRPATGNEMAELLKKSQDMQVFRTVLLKIMCDEPIVMEDLERFSEAKLFNLKKIVFIKFKKVIDTEFAKQEP